MNVHVPCRWQNNVLNYVKSDKENLTPPPQPPSITRHTPQMINLTPQTTKRSKWIDHALKEVMEVVERGMHSLIKASQFWNIPFISLFDHLNGKTRFRKIVYVGVLTDKENVVIVAWILIMQKCKLSPTLQQSKMKLLKLTQT